MVDFKTARIRNLARIQAQRLHQMLSVPSSFGDADRPPSHINMFLRYVLNVTNIFPPKFYYNNMYLFNSTDKPFCFIHVFIPNFSQDELMGTSVD